MSKQYSRRQLLRASAATTAALGGIGTVSAQTTDVPDRSDFEQIPTSDIRGQDIETVEAQALPEPAGGIGPGTQIFMYPNGGELAAAGITRPGGCTANFVWRGTNDGRRGPPGGIDLPDHVDLPDDGGLYLGAAGHCFLDDGAADKNAAREGEDGDDVSNVRVTACVDCAFGGGTTVFGLNGWGKEVGTDAYVHEVELGEVVYARQQDPEGSSGIGHDFGIVRIPEELEGIVDPSMPQWGGPDGVSEGPVPNGGPIHQYGAGVGNGEVFATMGSTGVSFGGTDNAWFAGIRASPGDSGSPIVASDPGAAPETGGAAAGVVTHLSTGGTAGTTIGRCKEMIKNDIGLELEVVQPGDLE